MTKEKHIVQDDVKDLKKEIYRIYVDEIADLIAIVEVYAHDLPRQISGLIEEIFRAISVSSSKDLKEKYQIYQTIIKYEYFLINILHLMIIDLYIKQIKCYTKTFKQFNCYGVKIKDSEDFLMEIVRKNIINVKKIYKDEKNSFSTTYRLNYLETLFYINKLPFSKYYQLEKFVSMKDSVEMKKLKNAYKSLDDMINLCEKHYSEVISNGYNGTLLVKFINNIPATLSFILTIITALTFLVKG